MTQPTTARLDLSIWRNDDVYELPLRVIGPNLTGVAMRAQIRMDADSPALLAGLNLTTNGNDEGIRLASATFVDGVWINDVRIRLNKSTRQALPYSGELGDSWAGVWVLAIAGKTRITGKVQVLAHALDSDAAPVNRPPSYSNYFSARSDVMPDVGATLTIAADSVAELVIDGADLVERAAGVAKDAADLSEVSRVASAAEAAKASLFASTALAAIGGVMYSSKAAGLAAAGAPRFFSVVGDNANTYAILYERSRGLTYDFSGGVPAGAAITRAVGPYSFTSGVGAVTKGTTANVARIERDIVTGAILGLLFEPERTNLMLWSEEISGVDRPSWDRGGSGTTATLSSAGSPSSGPYYTSNFLTNGVVQQVTPPTVTAGERVQLSVFARSAAASSINIGFSERATATNRKGANFVTATSWSRGSVDFTVAATEAGAFSKFGVLAVGAAPAIGARAMDLWGAQVERGIGASSYIMTTNATATRPAETLTLAVRMAAGSADVLLTYADGTTETRTGTVAANVLTLPASSVPRIVRTAYVVESEIDNATAIERARYASKMSYPNLAALKTATPDSPPPVLLTTTGPVAYAFVTGDFTGKADDSSVVALNGTPLTAGALVRQSSGGITYQQSGAADVIPASSAIGELGRTPASFGMVADATDTTAALQRMITAGDCTITKRDLPYPVSSTILIPAGRTVRIEPGARFLWTPASSGAARPWKSLFRPTGNNVSILINGAGRWYVEAAKGEDQFLSVLSIYGAILNTTMTGGCGINCTLIDTDAVNTGATYANVITQDMVAAGNAGPANAPQFVTIRGGGAIFPTHLITATTLERAGALLFYAQDVLIEDCEFQGCYAGVQAWGGDSGFSTGSPGLDPNAIRKSNRITVRRCSMKIGNAGFFASMVQDLVVEDSKSMFVRDVGFDPEGCWNPRISRCTSIDAYKGGFTTFAYNRNALFEDCHGVVSNFNYPLARIYNASLSAAGNRGVTFTGGSFVCNDPASPGTFDTGFGPVRALTVDGVKFENVVLSSNGGSQPQIKNCDLRFTRAMTGAFTAISLNAVNGTGVTDQPLALLENNRIFSEVAQPVGTKAIYASSGDFNSTPVTIIERNRAHIPLTSGGFAGIDCVGVDAGNGLAPIFQVLRNITSGPVRKAAYGTYVEDGNRNLSGGANALVVIP